MEIFNKYNLLNNLLFVLFLRSKRAVLTKIPDSHSKKKEDHSSDSRSSNDDLQVLNRSLSVKVVTPDDEFEYFNSSIRSGDEYAEGSQYSGPFYTPKKTKPKSEDYMTDSHREVINSCITPFEFTLLITDLLQELCKAESSLSGSEGSQISVQCINFSLRNLCALQFGSSPVCSLQYNAQEVSRVKVALTELLICSLDKVLIRSDLCAKLINNGILPMLLRILEDVIYKLKSKYCSKDYQTKSNVNKDVDSDETENTLKYVFGIASCIIAFFYSLLMQCRTVEKLKEFTEQFKLYADCHKGLLLKECIEIMMRIPGVKVEDAITLVKHLVESIGRLISGMKKIRSDVVHSAACSRNRHKVCRQRVVAGMHHHHDVLGKANAGLAESLPCCVSVLYGALTSLLIDEKVTEEPPLRTKILRVMLNCGVCCCFSPGLLMENIVRLMLIHCGIATLCLTVLEHTVYGELGASVLAPKTLDQLPCAVCETTEVKHIKSDQKCHSHVNTVQRKNLWSFLIHYNSLLQLDNHNNVLHSTVSHLLRVTPRCRMEMKYELLFSVIYPTFIVAKHRYIIRLEDSSYFLTVSCLNIFASLLNTVSFAEQFIQKGGLSYVLELVSLTEFSKQCCSILEIAIIVEIFKLMRQNTGDVTDIREIGSLASVRMLLKSLNEMTEKCFKIYKLKLPKDKFEELCDVNNECQLLGVTLIANKNESNLQVKITDFPHDSVTEETVVDYVEVLKNVWTFWKSCSGLCLYSPLFRRFLIREKIFIDTYSMTKILSYYLGNYPSSNVETRIVIKILESLLTIQLAVSGEYFRLIIKVLITCAVD